MLSLTLNKERKDEKELATQFVTRINWRYWWHIPLAKMHRGKKGCFRKPANFSSPIPNVQLFPQINMLHTHKVQCWLLNGLTFSSLTTLGFWAAGTPSTPCKSSQRRFLGPCVYSYLDYLGSPLMLLTQMLCLQGQEHPRWRLLCWQSLLLAQVPSSPLCRVDRSWGLRTEDMSSLWTFCLSLGFLNCWMFCSCSYDFTHWVPLVFCWFVCFLITQHLSNDIPIILELTLELYQTFHLPSWTQIQQCSLTNPTPFSPHGPNSRFCSEHELT